MAREHVSYTIEGFYDDAARFFREIDRSIAFGVIMFFSLVFLLVVPLLICSGVAFLLIGLPLYILFWWAAWIEVANDRHGEKPGPTIWDDQQTRWIEHTVRCVRYLESQGKTTDTSIVLSDDIYAATHKLIDDTDEATDKLLLSALLEPPYETDTFQHEPFYSLVAKRRRIIWDYRDKKGILHSGVVDSLGEALEKAKNFGYQSNDTAIIHPEMGDERYMLDAQYIKNCPLPDSPAGRP